MKPIEVGCLALVLGHEFPVNDGKVVRAERYMGDPLGVRYWAVSDDLEYRWKHSPPDIHPFCPEHNMFRIDGYTETEEMEEECLLER